MQTRPDTAFIHDIRVGWGDCDPANIAYSGRLPVFALEAIEAWWSAHLGEGGWFHMEKDLGIGTPFVRMELDFQAPVTPRHRLNCHVWPARLGTTSIEFRVDGLQNGTTCFKGRFVCVFTQAATLKKQAPPADIRTCITPHLPSAEPPSSIPKILPPEA